MRRPKMSTGAWIFTGLICAAVIAPASVYAAAVTKFALSNSSGSNVATITSQHQLLTTTIGPSHVVHAEGGAPGPCKAIYTPPAGKAIVLTSVVYTYGSGAQGSEDFGGLFAGPGCGDIVDQIDQIDKFGSIEHTFPIGLPMGAVYGDSSGGQINFFLTGYLIDASSLPASARVHGDSTAKSSRIGR
jgi:hypothetical protein